MIQIGIALKNRADVEVAFELSTFGGEIRTVDYSPYPRFFISAQDKPALIGVLTSKVVPSAKTVTNKSSANYLLSRFGAKAVWKTHASPLKSYAMHVIEVRLPTVSAFEVGELVRQKTPHSGIVQDGTFWVLRFPLDVVRIAVDAIEQFIKSADSPTAVQSAEYLLTDIELKLVRLGG